MSDVKFVGSVKQGKFENQLRFGFKLADLPKPNDGGYINLLICKSRDKNTWYAKVDNWQPNANLRDTINSEESF